MAGAVNVLMYHSISDADGPTSIDAPTFRGQMAKLAERGYRVISLTEFMAWHASEKDLPARTAVITFDDGFADFAECAAPELVARGWPATVFLPTGRLGGHEDWYGADAPARPLMTWEQVEVLARQGIDFGGHSVSHADLTKLDSQGQDREVRESFDVLKHRLGRVPVSFAPPYGHANAAVRATIGKWFRVSVGTRLQRATRACNILDVPRIEMHYFRDLARWDAYLDGRAELYFESRRALRRVRQIAVEHRWS
jgi:peptidoglycan/xylan/chitin deacetylase (PgdA/CDA1 family)